MERRRWALRDMGASSRVRIAASILLIMSGGVSGCASVSEKFAETASQMPGIGLPAAAPARPAADTMPYPAVHDLPPPRNSVVLTNTEAAQLEHDLVTARDQQQSAVGIRPPAKKKKQDPPAARKVEPVSSRASIY